VGFSPDDTPRYWLDQPYFTYARVLLAQGKYGDAERLLKNMEAFVSEERRLRKLITIQLLGALTLEAQGQRQPALRKVERALHLASPQGYRRAFLDEGSGLAGLLPAVRSTAPGFVDELLLSVSSQDRLTPPVAEPVNPLTERELEVLRLVAQGLSNRAIAERLVVTVGTVKKHLNNIFSKLYVSSRTQAVAKGRELGLLK
jgi:LuxR family maltose regulon positive regulatory protein